MAIIQPFAALRPRPELASRICAPPYDVLSSEEARSLARDNPLSFLHVSKPEIDLPPGTDPYSAAVYAKGRENFQQMIDQGVLRADAQPCFYFYRQTMGRHTQTGLVAVASCDDYLHGMVKKHELTRVDKEEDRVRHIAALDSQTGPVFLTYRAVPALDALQQEPTAGAPEIDFTSEDGVRHASWTVRDPEVIRRIEAEFARLAAVYIADGHHRCAAAARVFRERKGQGSTGGFLAVLFPHSQMQILPYNRVLQDLNGLTLDALRQRLADVFEISEPGVPQPLVRHQLGLYLAGRWHTLRFRPAYTQAGEAVDRLDVALLQRHVLAPVFGIDDPRISERVRFVGGIRGTAELERLVDAGRGACAFSMFPTGIDELMAIADAGGILPPKSTWFEPKLRDAMFCHLL